jgi:hypothetical protein
VLISSTGKKLFPHSTSSHKDPKIMKKIPAKSTKGTTAIKRVEEDNNDNKGEMSTN